MIEVIFEGLCDKNDLLDCKGWNNFIFCMFWWTFGFIMVERRYLDYIFLLSYCIMVWLDFLVQVRIYGLGILKEKCQGMFCYDWGCVSCLDVEVVSCIDMMGICYDNLE